MAVNCRKAVFRAEARTARRSGREQLFDPHDFLDKFKAVIPAGRVTP